MKRLLAILLCLVMLCALVACNNSTPNNGSNNNGTNGTNGTNGSNGTNGTNGANGGTSGTPDANGTAYRVGLGLTVDSTVSPAESDEDGRAEASVTSCALVLDPMGNIISVKFDCLEAIASYNTTGTVTWPDSYKSKKELGNSYGMKQYSAIGKEWYEQVNALESYCIGKTVSDVSSLQLKEVNGKQGIPANAELTSSCTISCDKFLEALKKAEADIG